MNALQRTVIKPGIGITPAVALVNPKYGHNAANAVRACSAWDVRQLWITGTRVLEEWQARGRLPREERMKAYGDVQVCLGDYFFDAYPRGSVTPVAVEVLENAEILTNFTHPENALYVFGPEDGSLPDPVRRLCHRFVIIPSRHCLNLASAVNFVLGHRFMQRQLAGLEPILPSYATLDEQRGWADADNVLV